MTNEYEEQTELADLKRHLLETLPAAEAEAVDRRVIGGETSEELLRWAESELAEDYLDGQLSAAEAERFRTVYLVTEERRARLDEIAALKNYASRASERGFPASVARNGFFRRFTNFFKRRPQPLIAALALLLVGIFAVFYLTAPRESDTEREFARLNRGDLSDVARFQTYPHVNLIGGAFRADAAGSQTFNLSAPRAERVFFRLALPVAPAAAQRFDVEVRRGAAPVFRQTALPFYTNPHGAELRLLVPASVLTAGAHQIRLHEAGAPESVAVYNFAVE